MNKLSGIKHEMPATEMTFQIEVTGEMTKKRFIGEFTCRIPTKKDLCLIDKHRAFLNGENADQLNPSTLVFHNQIAYLRYVLKEFPKFWRESDLGYALHDGNIVGEVYSKVIDFERQWLREIWGDEALEKFNVGPSDEPEETA